MRLETTAIHSGQKCDPATGSVVTPIHQTAAYVFDNAEQAEGRFLLKEFGPIYTRMGSPTQDQFEARMCALDGGAGALSTASGMTAVAYAIMNVCRSGDNFVTSRHLYGGVSNLFANILWDYGIEARFVEDHHNPDEFKQLTDEKTRLYWGETLPNPSLSVFPIEKIALAGEEMGVPLMIDNTCATPVLCKPFDYGASVSVYSATKYLGGHGNAIGGIIIDSGKFDWSRHKDRFAMLNDADPSMHGISWTEKFGELAYIIKARVTMMRDFGGCMAPMNAFLFSQGLETLSLRMERHCANAEKVAEFLQSHPTVGNVRYPKFATGRSKENAENMFGGEMWGPMIGMDLKGGTAAGQAFVENVDLFYHVANIGDTRSMAIHPASTTHSQMPSEERSKAGITDGYVRLCIGIEHIDDIIADLKQALDKVESSLKMAS